MTILNKLVSTTILAAGALVAVAALSSAAMADEAAVTPERLLNADAEPQNWLTTHQNYQAHRYSRLDQINRSNVANLHVAYIVGLQGHGAVANIDAQGTPLVDDGMMYVTDGWNRVYKIDARNGVNGAIQWVSDPQIATEGLSPRSRGPALWGDFIITNLLDGRVVAADRQSGEIVWDQQIAGRSVGWEIAEQFTAAPLATDNRIIVGQSRGDGGTRGWLAGLDPETGAEQWRWYSVPEPGQPGAETWKDDHEAWKTGGGAFWTTGSYDAAQRLTIWGTANPVPMFDPEYRPGDNLFTNSAVAVNIDDGALKWYFQYTPNESWDYDEQGVHVLFDTNIDGTMRQVVGHFGRNGFFYELDRNSGEFISAGQFVKEVNWTAGIDPKTGKPVEYDPNLAIQRYIPEARALRGQGMVTVCPTHRGGTRWQPPAYNPDTNVIYAVGADGCTQLEVTQVAQVAAGRGPGTGGRRTIPEYYGSLWSQNVITNERIASIDLPHDVRSGVLATAGGLVFIGQHDGWVSAHNSDTLEEMWRFSVGTEVKAPPMTFSYDGQQYIAVVTGGSPDADDAPGIENQKHIPMLLVFRL